MRKFLMVTMVAGLGLGMSQSATANYFYPGTVIIIGGGNGGGHGGTTKSAPAAAFDECQFIHLECECFPDMLLVDACTKLKQPVDCLTPETKYDFVDQPEPVLAESDAHRVIELKCTGQSAATAIVQLSGSLPEDQPPSP